MRIDKRQLDELRAVKITPGFMPTAEGSALIETGHTKVICSASVEDGVPGFKRGSGTGWVTAEYAMLPRATNTRTNREVNRGRPSGRTSEIQRLIGRSLRAAIDMKKLGVNTPYTRLEAMVRRVLVDEGRTARASAASLLAVAFRW